MVGGGWCVVGGVWYESIRVTTVSHLPSHFTKSKCLSGYQLLLLLLLSLLRTHLVQINTHMRRTKYLYIKTH